VLLVTFITAAGHAATYRVPQSYPTLAQANAIASAGDTILIARGVHVEPDWVNLKSGIRLIGDGGMTQSTLSISYLRIQELPPADSTATIIEGLRIVGDDGVQIGIDYNPLAIVRWNWIPTSNGRAIGCTGPITLEHNLIGTGVGCSIAIGDWNPTGTRARGILTVAHNTVLTRWRDGCITIEDGLLSSGSTIEHNTFLVASPDWLEGRVALIGDTFDLRISSNIFWGFWAACYAGATADWQYNCFYPWQSNGLGECSFPDATNLFNVDPEFCSPWDEDWRLGPASTCIGAGEDGTNIGALGVGCLLGVGDTPSGPVRELRVAPTPLLGPARITLSLDRAGPVSIELFDVCGRSVGVVFSGLLDRGGQTLTWSPPRLVPGVYLMRAQAIDQPTTATRVVIR
jgi:hypothetical protein